MPVSRKKSCLHCRTAKARCNLATPCSRCVERDLQCNYAHVYRSSSEVGPNNRQARVTSPPPKRIIEAGIRDPTNSNQNNCPLQDFDPVESIMHEDPISMIIEDLEWPESNWNDPNILNPLPNIHSLNPDSYDELLEHSSNPISPSAPISRTRYAPQLPLSANRDASNPNSPWHNLLTHPGTPFTQTIQSPSHKKGIVIIYNHMFKDVLTPRKATTTNTFLTTQVLWGQLKTYPKLLIQGQLPPFIYPPCVLSDQLPSSCVRNGIHQCLPDSLATCAGLVGMFEGRTINSSPFVWDGMYSEVRRMKSECHTYDQHMLLSAIQALVIYILLQTQDPRSTTNNDIGSLFSAIADIAIRALDSKDHLQNIYLNPNLTHQEWAFTESLRRTIHTHYILESILSSQIPRSGPMRCGGFDPIPVPCPRSLWDPSSTSSFAHRIHLYKTSMSLSISPTFIPSIPSNGTSASYSASTYEGNPRQQNNNWKELTVGDLRKCANGEATEEGRGRIVGFDGDRDRDGEGLDMDMVERVGRWCEDTDEFGGLLWMSTLLG